MSSKKLRIEIFSAPGCSNCNKAFQLTEKVLDELGDSIKSSVDLRKINIVEELDYAVDLGVRATPGIAINGVLVFTGMPGKAVIREAIESRYNQMRETE